MEGDCNIDDIELKTCPFCGKAMKIIKDRHNYTVQHLDDEWEWDGDCPLSFGWGGPESDEADFDTPKEAALTWNKRHTPDENIKDAQKIIRLQDTVMKLQEKIDILANENIELKREQMELQEIIDELRPMGQQA